MHRITLNIYLGALPLSQQSSWFYLACCSCHVQTALQMAFARAVWYSSLHRSEHSFVLLRKPHSTMTAVHGLSRKTRYSELPFAVRVLDGSASEMRCSWMHSAKALPPATDHHCKSLMPQQEKIYEYSFHGHVANIY